MHVETDDCLSLTKTRKPQSSCNHERALPIQVSLGII